MVLQEAWIEDVHLLSNLHLHPATVAQQHAIALRSRWQPLSSLYHGAVEAWAAALHRAISSCMIQHPQLVPAGMASIATLPISLICASIFSEVAWARCWASASDKVLKLGALYGTIQVNP